LGHPIVESRNFRINMLSEVVADMWFAIVLVIIVRIEVIALRLLCNSCKLCFAAKIDNVLVIWIEYLVLVVSGFRSAWAFSAKGRQVSALWYIALVQFSGVENQR
jgi:hypothetical protein